MAIATADVGSVNIMLDFRGRKPVVNEIGQMIAWNAARTEILGVLKADYTQDRFFDQSGDDYMAVDTAVKRTTNPAKVFFTDERAEILYAESTSAYDQEVAANPSTAVRRPESWMLPFNPFTPTPQLSAPVEVSGQSAAITLWGYHASLAAAQTAAGMINATWLGDRFASAPGNNWVHGYGSLPTVQPANTQLYLAYTTAFKGSSGWTYATPQASLADSAFDIQFTAEANPNTSTTGHHPRATGDRHYRVRLPNGFFGPWTPLASNPTTDWNIVCTRLYDWTEANVQINFANVLDLSNTRELLFSWEWREHEYQSTVASDPVNNSTTWVRLSDPPPALGTTVMIGSEVRVVAGNTVGYPYAIVPNYALSAIPAAGTVVRTPGTGTRTGYAEGRIAADRVRATTYSSRASYTKGKTLLVEFNSIGPTILALPPSNQGGRAPGGTQDFVQTFSLANLATSTDSADDHLASLIYFLGVYARNRPAEFRLMSR